MLSSSFTGGHWSCDDRHTLRSYHAHDNAEAGSLARFVHCLPVFGWVRRFYLSAICFPGLHMSKCPLPHVFFHIASLVLFHCWWFLPNNGLICGNIDPPKKEPWIGVVQCFWPINRWGFRMREWILHKMTKIFATSNFPHPNVCQRLNSNGHIAKYNGSVDPKWEIAGPFATSKDMCHGFYSAGATERELHSCRSPTQTRWTCVFYNYLLMFQVNSECDVCFF